MTIIIVGLATCSSCANNKVEKDSIKYESGIFHDKNWDETIGTYSDMPIVPDKQTAVKAAKAVFDGMEKSKEVQTYTPQSVFYDTQDEIWIVSFWNGSDKTALGGDCNIAIRKKDGKVLRVWFGE